MGVNTDLNKRVESVTWGHSNSDMKWAVFTDLDGTFLDHHTYDYQAAVPVVRKLRAHGIPVFSVSSKTLAEQKALFDHLELFDGYVAENGGVVWFEGQMHLLGPDQADIAKARQAIETVCGHEVPSFRPKYLEEVIRATGLSRSDAALACERVCSDPLILNVNDQLEKQFNEVIDTGRTRLVRGGRFLTLCGHSDKAQAMQFLVNKLSSIDKQVYTIALGDSANDLPMLQAADHGVWMPNPDGSGLSDSQKQGLRQAPTAGPQGWGQAILTLFNELGMDLN